MKDVPRPGAERVMLVRARGTDDVGAPGLTICTAERPALSRLRRSDDRAGKRRYARGEFADGLVAEAFVAVAVVTG